MATPPFDYEPDGPPVLPKAWSSTPFLTGDDREAAQTALSQRLKDKQLSLWADPAMHSAAPQPTGDDGRVRPTVRILQATPDPLGTLAAVMAIYKGGVKRSLAGVTDDERREALAEMLKTKLQGPLETITFTILVEGVSRSFTHQMVRGRKAFYAQESMRFAVPDEEDWTDRVARPVGYQSWTERQQNLWDDSVSKSQEAYDALVGTGVPAEDARGLMPHAMTTRLVWQVDLRELLHVAGLRLCTQAQFEWRTVLSLVARELRAWGAGQLGWIEDKQGNGNWARRSDGWQFTEIADLLRPVCFQEGKCGFMSAFDRSCTIRGRVDANAKVGRDSSDWDKPYAPCNGGLVRWYDGLPGETNAVPHNGHYDDVQIDEIRPEEWLADPNAAKGGRNG